MGVFTGIKNMFDFGYDAVESTPKRRVPQTVLRSEDDELLPAARTALVSTTRDLIRNYAAAKWAIAKHLDYVSTFHFASRTGNEAFDNQFERLFDWWGQPKNCDIAGRHDFSRFIRLTESRATVDGDIWLVKLSSGELQAIESDRVRTPYELSDVPIPDGGRIIQGVVVDEFGRVTGICVFKRQVLNQFSASAGSGAFVFEKFIAAKNIVQHGYFDRFDQVRGISPLASGLNTFRDVCDASEYALVKAKVCSLFGIKFVRQGTDELPQSTTNATEGYSVDFGKGAFALDLQPGDDATFMESQHPSTSFQDYMNLSLAVALKSLDIPFSFFNEAFTNYSGARQAFIHYDQSAKIKRRQLALVLDNITEWKLNTWVAAGLITLPLGQTVTDIAWEWVPAAIPWIDPLKESQASIAAINAGLDSRTRICKEMGLDFNDIVDQLKKEQEMLVAAGLNPVATPIPTITINEAD